VLAALEERKL